MTSRPPPWNGNGLNRTAFTRLKTVVFTPIPKASVTTIAAENQGFFRIIRKANRRSCAQFMVVVILRGGAYLGLYGCAHPGVHGKIIALEILNESSSGWRVRGLVKESRPQMNADKRGLKTTVLS